MEFIVASPPVAAIAAAKVLARMPIVQVGGASPVDTGLAATLARPGEMVTGLTSLSAELRGRFFELLLAAAPKVKRVGILGDVKTLDYPIHIKNTHAAIERLRIEARFAEVAAQKSSTVPCRS